MKEFFKLCLIIWLINQTVSQIASCDYKYDYHSTTGFKSTNTSYYKCDMDTSQSNYDEELIRIDGEHVAGHSHGDVKWIQNYEDQRLKTFSSIFCQMFPNLEVIQINDAKLKSIDDDSLMNCKNLDMLLLFGNKIRELPEYLLIRNSKLTKFRIFDNQLTTLPEDLFLNQKNLKDLFLSENKINFLPSHIFRPLVNLEVLYMQNNNLKSINPAWFSSLQKLKWLSFERNRISEIPSNCFASLRSLERLWLYKNRIQTLNSNSFDKILNLRQLDLRSNEISDLPVGVFTPLKNLQELYLFDNWLTTIHSDSFGIHNQLTTVYFGHNKINAIDEKFIDNTAISFLRMDSNICSQSKSFNRAEIKNNFRNCFANYQPRPVLISNTCGRSIIPQGTIFGGDQIKQSSYPWIAALMRPNGQFFCGGTLVSNRKVVTAAHCMKPKGHKIPLASNQLNVILGYFNLDIPSETGRVNLSVHSIHIHPDWSTRTQSYDADVAVVLLKNQVEFSPQIQPICMTLEDLEIDSVSEGFVVGNGKSGQYNKYENIPKILKMPIQEDEICMEKDSFFKTLSSGRTFCAGSADGTGVCSGDSGSGFVVKIGTAYYLRGIVSVSLGDPMLGCDVKSFAVFSDALKFVNWINRIPIIDEDRYIFSYK